MAFRFRKSIKIAPGIRVNLNKKSTSVRIGPKGLGYTISSTGQKRVSAGIPGSGLSYSEVVAPKRQNVTYEAAQLIGDQSKPKSKRPLILLLIAMALGIGWCSSQSDKSTSTTTSSGSGQPITTSSPSRPTTPSQPAQNATIAPLSAPLPDRAATTLYTTANVRLRTDPSTDAGIILTVQSGSAVTSTKLEGAWHYVTYRDHRGWIRGDYLAARRPQPPRAAPSNVIPLLGAPARPRATQPPRPSFRSGYIRGPRGGCYYINRNGNKTYVDRSMCN